MHPRARDLTGLRVGYLTGVRYAGSDGRNSLWEFRCDCGNVVTVPASEMTKQLKRGIRASCGCMRRRSIGESSTKHGMSGHPAYWVWRSMRDRCRLPTHQAWKNYGGRGISVCARWEASFENFWEDMGSTYGSVESPSLERVDNNGDYEPANCKWIPKSQQTKNRRDSLFLDTPKGRMSLRDASRTFGIGVTTLDYRLKHGVPADQILMPPNVSNRFSTSSTAEPSTASPCSGKMDP